MSGPNPNRNSGLIGKDGLWVGNRLNEVQVFDAAGNQVNAGFRKTWFVDTNVGVDNAAHGATGLKPWLTMDKAFDAMEAGDVEPGDRILFRGNINEQLTSRAGSPGITIEGAGNRPQHADTHPLNVNKYAATWKIGALGNNPLLILRNPGWVFKNILFAAHASNYAVRLERNAIEDATEQDASHAQFIGCRFASGGGGISDTGGCVDVGLYGNRFEALTVACILGVGNIGAGQSDWDIQGNTFDGFTNGVKIAAFGCRIQDNTFTKGGTPNTTFVLHTVNATGDNNFVVKNFFQTADANYSTPDLVGSATDVWRNDLIDATAKTGTP